MASLANFGRLFARRNAQHLLGAGAGGIELSLVVTRAEFVALNASHLYNGFEATVEHSLAIEWHALRVAHLVNARVSHDFFVHTVAMRA